MVDIDNSKEIAIFAAVIAQEKKGKDVVVIDFEGLSSLYDYVVITSAFSNRETKAIASAIDLVFKNFNFKRRVVQGMEGGGWILLDYGSIVIHIFAEQDRELPFRSFRPAPGSSSNYRLFYNLEELWRDMPRLDFENEPAFERLREEFLKLSSLKS